MPTTATQRALIESKKHWVAFEHQHPALVVETSQPPTTYPFYVLAVESEFHDEKWVHHFFTAADMQQLGPKSPGAAIRDPFTEGKIPDVEVSILPCKDDHRGHLVEIYRNDTISTRGREGKFRVDYPPMTYLSVTHEGQQRGPHEHTSQTDIFTFCETAFEMFLWDNRDCSPTYNTKMRVLTSEKFYTQVIIPPGVVHAYCCVSGTGLVVNCPDKLYRGWGRKQPVDEVRHEEDINTPFRVW